MIGSLRHKGLSELWTSGRSRLVAADQQRRILDALATAVVPEDMNLPGLKLHGLRGAPKRYAVSVNAQWRITFGWHGQDAVDVDLEQYH